MFLYSGGRVRLQRRGSGCVLSNTLKGHGGSQMLTVCSLLDFCGGVVLSEGGKLGASWGIKRSSTARVFVWKCEPRGGGLKLVTI